jgi:hypothetical protein
MIDDLNLLISNLLQMQKSSKQAAAIADHILLNIHEDIELDDDDIEALIKKLKTLEPYYINVQQSLEILKEYQKEEPRILRALTDEDIEVWNN